MPAIGSAGGAPASAPGSAPAAVATPTAALTEPASEAPPAFRLTSPDPPATERPSPRYRVPWADLLRKVFAIDVLACARCAGRLDLIAFISVPDVARRILDHLGLASEAPPLARARAPDDPGGAEDAGPDYHSGDPIFDE